MLTKSKQKTKNKRYFNHSEITLLNSFLFIFYCTPAKTKPSRDSSKTLSNRRNNNKRIPKNLKSAHKRNRVLNITIEI